MTSLALVHWCHHSIIESHFYGQARFAPGEAISAFLFRFCCQRGGGHGCTRWEDCSAARPGSVRMCNIDRVCFINDMNVAEPQNSRAAMCQVINNSSWGKCALSGHGAIAFILRYAFKSAPLVSYSSVITPLIQTASYLPPRATNTL